MSIPLILVILLGAWWLLLTIWVVSCYLERVRDAKTPLTPEQLKECRKLEESMPRVRMRPRDYVVGGPFIIVWIFFLLPFYLYSWFLKYRDPYDRHHKT
jgi:hypothetical protein